MEELQIACKIKSNGRGSTIIQNRITHRRKRIQRKICLEDDQPKATTVGNPGFTRKFFGRTSATRMTTTKFAKNTTTTVQGSEPHKNSVLKHSFAAAATAIDIVTYTATPWCTYIYIYI